jgi:hypothetical protein
MSECNEVCCFSFLILIIFLIPTFWVSVPSYQSSLPIKPKNFYQEESFRPKVELDAKMGHVIKNSSYSPCENPFDHACKVDYSIHRTMVEHNQNVMKHVEKEYIRNTHFYKKCIDFQSSSFEEKINNVIKTDFFIHQFEAIESLRNYKDLEGVFGILSVYGIKSPIELSSTMNGEYQLSRSIHFDFETEKLKYLFKFMEIAFHDSSPEIHVDYIKRFEVDFDVNEFILTNTKLDYHKDIFNFKAFLGKDYRDTMYIDLDFLAHFNFQKTKYTVEDWRWYLKAIISLYTLNHFRMFPSDPEHTCTLHYKQLFPIHVCHYIKDQLNLSTFTIKGIVEELKKSYIKWIDKNEYEFSENFKRNVKNKLKIMNVYINQCWMSDDLKTKEHLTFVEQDVLDHDDYVKGISHLFKNEKFRTFRNALTDRYNKNLIAHFMNWNAWYETKDNSLVIPPGSTDFHLKRVPQESCMFKAYVGSIIGHELFHLIYSEIVKFKTKKWLEIETNMKKYGLHNLEENLADLFGSSINHETFLTETEKQCFFLTYIRIWCDDESQLGHSRGKIRSLIPLEFLQKEYEKVFHCKL